MNTSIPSSASGRERFYGLEWLRFLMALSMVVYHFGGLYGDLPLVARKIIGMGFFATSTFFMLSGFLLAHVALDAAGRLKGSAPAFVARRLCNLYPIHLITLLLALSLLLFQYPIVPEGVYVYYNSHPYVAPDAQLRELFGARLPWVSAIEHIGLQLFLLQAWEPRFLWLNGASWSISALFFFYLCFPSVAPRLMGIRRWGLALLAIWGLYMLGPLLATLSQAFDHVTVGLLHRNPLFRLPEFLVGILLYRAHREAWVRDALIRHRHALITLALCGVPLGAWLLTLDGTNFYYLVHNGLLLPFQALLLLGASALRAPRGEKSKRLAQRLGEAALCIFVLHTPLIGPFARATRWSIEQGAMIMQLDIEVIGLRELPIWSMPFHLLVIVALALSVQRWVVAPTRSWLEARLPRAWQRQPKREAQRSSTA